LVQSRRTHPFLAHLLWLLLIVKLLTPPLIRFPVISVVGSRPEILNSLKIGHLPVGVGANVVLTEMPGVDVGDEMVEELSDALGNVPDKEAALKDHIDAFKTKYKKELSSKLKRVWNVKYTAVGKDHEGKPVRKGADEFKAGPDLWMLTNF
jgi:hypothetical protein